MKDTPTKTILMTGGHLTPAVATIEALQRYPVEIVFVGRKQTDHLGTPSHEEVLVKQLGTTFIPFNAPKLYRKPIHLNFIQVPLVFKALRNAKEILNTHKPDVIVSFGGYLALPIAVVAKVLSIPVIVHEQTMVMGLTNQLLSRLATKVFVSWPTTLKAPSKAEVIGNPVRQVITKDVQPPPWYRNPDNLPIVYITGGNQGSITINDQIEKDIDELTQSYFVIHQTGSAKQDYSLKRIKQAVKSLPKNQQSRLIAQKWFDAQEVSWILSNAALVISRSGANTVTELLMHKKPAVLIPLPISARREQQHNAKLLEKLGLATVLEQQDLSQLLDTINQRITSTKSLKVNQQLNALQQLHLQAADTLAKEIVSCA